MRNENYPMEEVEQMIKREREQNEFNVDEFATISGIKGKQFGREIFSSLIRFKDLMDFLEVFPDVQRSVNKRRVNKIKNYVLSGIEDETAMRFFSAITVTCRGDMYYNEKTHRIAINTKQSKLSANDGQHRFYGISEAIRVLEGQLNKAKYADDRESINFKLDKLKDMVVPLVIFNEIGEREEKQLFHDLNNLAQRPSRSATIKLAQTDRISQMAREIATENRYLKHYGVEMDKMSIGANNDNTVLLTTVYVAIKFLFYKEYLADNKFLTDQNFGIYKKIANDTFDKIFHALPHDINVKDKYIVEKNYTLKGIARFIHDSRNKYAIKDEYIFETIENATWTKNIDVWENYGGSLSVKGNLQFGGGDGAINAVYNYLMDSIKENLDIKAKIAQVEEGEAYQLKGLI